MKTLDDYFNDWESHVFGYGYGTGEEYTLLALQRFLELCSGEHFSYQYEDMQNMLGCAEAWLMINIMGHANIIEYGTSPRYGWLTPQGKRLREYVVGRSVESLCEATFRPEDYSECYPDHCNCDDGPCHNPFWNAKT